MNEKCFVVAVVVAIQTGRIHVVEAQKFSERTPILVFVFLLLFFWFSSIVAADTSLNKKWHTHTHIYTFHSIDPNFLWISFFSFHFDKPSLVSIPAHKSFIHAFDGWLVGLFAASDFRVFAISSGSLSLSLSLTRLLFTRVLLFAWKRQFSAKLNGIIVGMLPLSQQWDWLYRWGANAAKCEHASANVWRCYC